MGTKARAASLIRWADRSCQSQCKAPLRNRRFFSLAELYEAIATQVAWLNGRAFRDDPHQSRRELFEELERKALRPLPTERFELAEWKKATVNIDYHVEFDHRYYSVPYQLVRQRLDVRGHAEHGRGAQGRKARGQPRP